ncbi:uncharacterized protein si:ch211-241j12.4 [Periophthalmus magnuspinnatus]|uniref:uncharacterized protein si:ch211-241j12.4 n=1 Tax=Periophthalmus magnuspinnatus TaxID=409849 RepID=UPI0024365D28|nr:uncharacterized protein si:ch211-241j12.4 [Periophthalmus magnuspinnatus]
MSRRFEGVWTQSSEPSSQLPADHVLFSGAVLFPGAFDQLGCPLVVFPVDGQTRLSTALSKPEVVDFINYCLSQHNKTQKSSLVSVVADLREASASSTRFIAETLLLLEQQKRTVHSAYIIQPKRKDVLRLLGKLWSLPKLLPNTFKKVLLKDVFELSNYIDRSQLMASLGGYLVYCHQSWAVFIKEMDVFEEHFVSVVKQLPGCLSSLQTLSTLPLPNSLPELQLFCSSNETHFQQLQRDLGLDDLLRHCKLLMEKLRSPDLDPHFQAMAGTALFTLHFSSMLQYHHRISTAVQKVELLWQEVFSKARLQLHVLQMREAALQITEQIESLLQRKLQPYNIQMARDGTEAERLTSEFHSSVYTPAMSLVVAAEEVVCTLTEQLCDALSKERWLLDLYRLKDKLHSTVHLTLQTLQAVSKYHLFYNKAQSWYKLVLSENFLQKLLSEVDRPRRSWGTLPTWRKRLFAFLKNSPPPDMEELVHLAHLSQVIPDKQLQQEGRQLSHRCVTLRRMIMSSEPLAVAELQVTLQWQYEFLQSSLVKQREHSSPTDTLPALHTQEVNPRVAPHTANRVDLLRHGTTEGKPSSHSSFDSGFEGAGSSMLEGHTLAPDFVKQTMNQPQIQEETMSNLSDSGGFGSLGNLSRPTVRIAPNETVNSLDFEIKVKRSAAYPTNPWLSLPGDDLENSYTVTITSKPSLEHRDAYFSSNSQKNKELCPVTPAASLTAWALHTQSSLEDCELSPMTHVLSSTVTEPNDQATEGSSMLWDSYDLHEQYLDVTEGVSAPYLKDWDKKEEDNLTEVERTLERTDKILAEEESVLAQEVQLDVLLQTEVGPHPWVAWNNQMSLDELSKGNVVVLNQFGVESQFDTDFGASPQPGDWRAKPDLLTELKDVYALDKKILEENLKIHQLRQEDRPGEVAQRSSDMLNVQNIRMQLTTEKLEQKAPEKTSVRNCQVKKCKEQATRVIRCSIMSRTESEEDRILYNELLSGQSSPEGSHSKDEPSQSCSSDPPQAKETDTKLQDDATHPPNQSPVTVNIVVSSRNPAQPPSASLPTVQSGVTPRSEQGIERGSLCSQPIPKPRKKAPSLKNPTKQHSTHCSKDGSVPPVDTMDAYAFSMNTEEVTTTPIVDKLNLEGTSPIPVSSEVLLTENSEDKGGASAEGGGEVLAEDTEGGGGVLAEDTEGGGGVLAEDTEGGGGVLAEDTEGGGGVLAEDTEGGGGVLAEDTDGGGPVPVEDTEPGGSRPTEDTGDSGAPAEDTEPGGSRPTEDTGDSGAPAEDTGDSGAPAEDTGDSGAPAEDTGDSGAPAEDTGDSGAPAEDTGDSGAPAEDTGDSGAPAEDTGDSGAPAEDTGDSGAPAEDTGDRH